MFHGVGMHTGMAMHPQREDLHELVQAQCGVVARGQLVAIGASQSTIFRRCQPGGRWQQPLPKVIVLHSGPLSAEQRRWAALCYAAAYPLAQGVSLATKALISGEVALDLQRGSSSQGSASVAASGFEGSGTIDVLVPHDCSVRSYQWVRVVRTRRFPTPVVGAGGIPLTPVVRAGVEAVRVAVNSAHVRRLLYRLVGDLGADPDAVRSELKAERLARRSDVAVVMRQVQAGTRSSAQAEARTLILDSGLPEPLWNPALHLASERLGTPDAYWPDHGVVLEIDSATPHRRVSEEIGLRLVCASPDQLRYRPRIVLRAMRAALSSGPHGPVSRITTDRDRRRMTTSYGGVRFR